MRKFVLSLLFALPFSVRAEVHPMTLRQAVETAMKQNPDIVLARLDEEKARDAVRIAKDPFWPTVVVGSGLAYSNGFPMSIEGSAPSVVQARASQFLFNRPQHFVIAQAKEDARGAGFTVASRRDEVAYRVASLYMDAERGARLAALAQKDIASEQKVLETVEAQVAEGRALPLAQKTAAYNLAYARQVAEGLEDDQATAETALAMAMGMPATDRVRTVEEPRTAPPLLESEDQAIQTALASNNELRRLESQIAAKQLEVQGGYAARLPRADLVAQYAMLARFNNYDEFFRKFQRNNGQLGVSLQLPVFSPGVKSQVAASRTDIARLQVDLNNTRNRIGSDIQESYRTVRKSETAANVARLALDLAREQLSVDLARFQEGRASLREVEEARISENQKWIGFYDAQYALEKARWNVLRLTGALLPALGVRP